MSSGLIGWMLSILAAAICALDGGVMLIAPRILARPLHETGFDDAQLPFIGWYALVGVVLYLLPLTSAIGAILLTAFLGGAISAHLRLGRIASPPQIVSLAIGVALWVGLMLRDERIGSALLLGLKP